MLHHIKVALSLSVSLQNWNITNNIRTYYLSYVSKAYSNINQIPIFENLHDIPNDVILSSSTISIHV